MEYAQLQKSRNKPRPLAVVVKSVVDFVDGTKNDRYHMYRSASRAQMLRVIAEDVLPAGD